MGVQQDHQNDETAALSQARQSNDRGRIERLLGEHREYLQKVIAIRMDPRLGRRLDVSDIVQEAQLEAFRRIDDYLAHPAVPLRLWLRKLACEQLIMAQRRHITAEKRSIQRERRLPERSSDDIAEHLMAQLDSPSRQVSAKETAHRLRDAVDSLREKDREIVLLQVFEGLTGQESALVLGIEPAAARKRFGRALLRLRQLLADRGMGAPSQ